MDDLISRWAAIDALTDTNLKRNVDSLCDGDMNRTRRAAQRVIAQLPAVDAVPVVQQWISVKDRLPVNLGTVIVAHKAGVSFAYFNGAYWERGAATKHKPIKTITHWMPLPEPPKMDGESNG